MHRVALSTAALATSVLLAGVPGRAQDPSLASVPDASADRNAKYGAELYAGLRAFEHHGPACVSCHDATDRRRLESGGITGPDLSRAYRRLGGDRRMGDWLMHPPTPMMHTTFTSAPLSADEVRALTAFLERAAGGTATLPVRLRGGAPSAH